MLMHNSLVCLQISYYDISRGVYDLAGRVKVTGSMGMPLCLSSAVGEKTEQENIIYGDDSGAAIMLQCGRGELPARVLKPGDFTYVHDDHTDWVTQVRVPAWGRRSGGGPEERVGVGGRGNMWVGMKGQQCVAGS